MPTSLHCHARSPTQSVLLRTLTQAAPQLPMCRQHQLCIRACKPAPYPHPPSGSWVSMAVLSMHASAVAWGPMSAPTTQYMLPALQLPHVRPAQEPSRPSSLPSTPTRPNTRINLLHVPSPAHLDCQRSVPASAHRLCTSPQGHAARLRSNLSARQRSGLRTAQPACIASREGVANSRRSQEIKLPNI